MTITNDNGTGICEECRAGVTQRDLMPPYLQVPCRGVAAFGGVRNHPDCDGPRIVTASYANATRTSRSPIAGLDGLQVRCLPGFDPSDRTYRCSKCGGLERWLAGVQAQASRHEINSWAAASDFMSEAAKRRLHWEDETRPPPPVGARRGSRTSARHRRRLIASRWGSGATRIVVGLCPCGELTLSRTSRPVEFHWLCWTASKRGTQLEVFGPRRRGPVPQKLTRDFSWAVCHLLRRHDPGPDRPERRRAEELRVRSHPGDMRPAAAGGQGQLPLSDRCRRARSGEPAAVVAAFSVDPLRLAAQM